MYLDDPLLGLKETYGRPIPFHLELFWFYNYNLTAMLMVQRQSVMVDDKVSD